MQNRLKGFTLLWRVIMPAKQFFHSKTIDLLWRILASNLSMSMMIVHLKSTMNKAMTWSIPEQSQKIRILTILHQNVNSIFNLLWTNLVLIYVSKSKALKSIESSVNSNRNLMKRKRVGVAPYVMNIQEETIRLSMDTISMLVVHYIPYVIFVKTRYFGVNILIGRKLQTVLQNMKQI